MTYAMSHKIIEIRRFKMSLLDSKAHALKWPAELFSTLDSCIKVRVMREVSSPPFLLTMPKATVCGDLLFICWLVSVCCLVSLFITELRKWSLCQAAVRPILGMSL